MAVIIGFLEVHLYIPEARSLKEKRSVVKSVLEKTKKKFNVSASEIGKHDAWQNAVIGFVLLGTSQQVVDATLEKIVAFIENLYPGKVMLYHKEFL